MVNVEKWGRSRDGWFVFEGWFVLDILALLG